jgi:hypothetical protein
MMTPEISGDEMDEALEPFGLDYAGVSDCQDEDGSHNWTAQATDRDRGISISARSYRGEGNAQTKLLDFLRGDAGERCTVECDPRTDQRLRGVYEDLLGTLEGAVARAREDAASLQQTQEFAPDEEGRYRDADLAISMLRKLLLGAA